MLTGVSLLHRTPLLRSLLCSWARWSSVCSHTPTCINSEVTPYHYPRYWISLIWIREGWATAFVTVSLVPGRVANTQWPFNKYPLNECIEKSEVRPIAFMQLILVLFWKQNDISSKSANTCSYCSVFLSRSVWVRDSSSKIKLVCLGFAQLWHVVS